MSSQRVAIVSAIAFSCIFLCTAATAGTIFTANLTGDQEVPPVETNASGTAIFELSDDQSTLSYSIETFGLDIGSIKTEEDQGDDIVGAHIHIAPAGENGPIVFGIFRPQHDKNDRLITINGESGLIKFEGVWDAADVANDAAPLADHLDDLFAGNLYINIHTTEFPGGEIRGQIIPEPSTLLLLGSAFAVLALTRRRRR
jgi:hypothetical protein